MLSTAGFSHEGLDSHQREWYSHYYPYKLGSYRKRRLSDVTTVASISYIDGNVALAEVDIPVVAPGTAHCVGIWVDFQLSESSVFELYRDEDFCLYAKTLVKFLETPLECTEINVIKCVPTFAYGDSSIDFDFIVK